MSQPFRFVSPYFQFLYQSALKVLAGGQLFFYESGTSTPQATYTDSSLTTENPNPVQLNSAGVPEADIWMNGNYRVVIEDVNGNVLGTYDNVEIPGGSAQSIPSLVEGEFLTNDGSNLIWQAIAQIPTMTGQSGKYLTNNGSAATWATLTIPQPDINVVENSGNLYGDLTSGSSGALVLSIQAGSGSAPASGGSSTSASVTFPKAFVATPYVCITPTTNTAASAGIPVAAVIGAGTTGFSAFFNNAVNTSAGGAINNQVTFDWIAIGIVSAV
jgi:hypothetical protein